MNRTPLPRTNRLVAADIFLSLSTLTILFFPHDAFLPLIDLPVGPYKGLLDGPGRTDSHTASRVMKKIEWLVPGTYRDAPAAAGIPLPLIDRPEGQAAIGLHKPFLNAAIIEDRVGRFLRGWPERNGIGRTVLRAILTGHAELVNTEGDRLIHL